MIFVFVVIERNMTFMNSRDQLLLCLCPHNPFFAQENYARTALCSHFKKILKVLGGHKSPTFKIIN